MIEKEQDFFCQIHKAPVLMITCDQEKKKNQRFLCSQCMEHLDLKTQLMNFQKAHQYIQVNQELKKQSIENVLMININQLQYLQNTLYQLKSSVIQQLDQLIGNAEEWIKQIQSRGSAHLAYSFFDELEILITNSKFDQFDQKSIVDQINFINQSWIHKIMNKINLFKQFQETQKCSELLNNIMFKGNQQNDIMNQNEVEQEDKELQQNQLEFKSMIDQRIEIKLIDDSNKQIGYCFAIVFDKTDSIMVSCSNNEIKIWNFKLGRLSLINTYQEHSKAVTCLVYSKIKNTFISGSHDHTILCWQQINQKEWKCSQKYQQHNGTVHCLMLTQDEDQLLSGGCDHSIKVWKIDFIKNELNFQYSLNNHGNSVKSFSFNESETLLISCGLDHFIIWEKGQQGKWEFKYTQPVANQGRKIHVINDQKFLWVTKNEYIDDILVLEYQNGVFKYNIDASIKLIMNNKCEDDAYFPIIYNKEKNILLVRHKHHIYLIRQLNNGRFEIMTSLNCLNDVIFGTMTNNGQYLVFWDMKNLNYQSYEIVMI